MEGPLPHRSLLGVRNGAVSVEVTVPFATFLIGKVTECVEVSLFKPFPILFVAGEAVCEKGSDTSFVVYPPKLHIVLELLAGTTAYVGEVNEAAKIVIPAPFEGNVEDLKSVCEKLLVAGVDRLVHKEPAVLHRVTGVNGSACGIVDEFAVGTYGFEYTAKLGLVVDIDDDICHFLSDLGIILSLFGVCTTESLGAGYKNHGIGNSTLLSGRGIALRSDFEGVGAAVAEDGKHHFEAFLRLSESILITAHDRVFCHRENVEAFGEEVATLSERKTFLGESEVHSSVGICKVFVNEVLTKLCSLFPFGTDAVDVAKTREGPKTSALEPTGLVGVVSFTFSVDAGDVTTVFLVEKIAVHPEGNAVLQELIVIEFAVGCERCLIHVCLPSLMFFYILYLFLCSVNKNLSFYLM